MSKYHRWMSVGKNTEDSVFDLADKTDVIVGENTYSSIVNKATQWHKNVDYIWLVKKSDYTPSHGEYVEFKNNTYIIFFVPEERESYWSCKIRLCNTILFIQGEKVPIKWDPLGNVIEWSDGESMNIPCVADKSLVYGEGNFDSPVNLPDNKIKVSIPYLKMKLDKFSLYGEDYKVRDLDMTQTYKNKGVIIITGERSVENNEQ